MSITKTLAGGGIGGGLAALAASAYYGSNVAAAMALGLVYPAYLIGSAVLGTYIFK